VRSARLVALALGAGAISFTAVATADPQGNAGITIGVAGRGYDRGIWDETVFHLGMRGDVMFARDDVHDFGVGPYLELFTYAFDELQMGGGVSLLLPVIDTFPIVASVGSYARIGEDDFGFEPGIATALFFGSRGYNFTSNYVMAGGLLVQARFGLGDSGETSILLGAHLDTAFLGLPIVFLIDALRGGSPETDPVPRE
jgi:hypothetical protein